MGQVEDLSIVSASIYPPYITAPRILTAVILSDAAIRFVLSADALGEFYSHAEDESSNFNVLVSFKLRHGPISDCPMPVFEQFVQQYMSLPEHSPSRRALEQRYGKANIARLVRKYEEEKANREWLENSTTSCPSCQVRTISRGYSTSSVMELMEGSLSSFSRSMSRRVTDVIM